jgi:hypothetical protein
MLLSSQALADPPPPPVGDPLPVIADHQQPGSFLVFPKFDLRGAAGTKLRITNLLDLQDVAVKINYVCPGVKHVNDFCDALDRRITLTPHETRVIDVADHNPPCDAGFAVAFALSKRTLKPISYNYLIGSYHIAKGRRSEADNALSIQSPLPYGTEIVTTDGLSFGGDYLPLASQLFTTFQAVDPVDEEGSKLVLLSLDTRAGMQNPATTVWVDFWNAVEVPFSSSWEYVCWTEVRLDDIDYNFLEENMETCEGSMTIVPVPNCPVPGLCPPMPEYDPVVLGMIEEYGPGVATARNLQHNGYPKSTVYYPR